MLGTAESEQMTPSPVSFQPPQWTLLESQTVSLLAAQGPWHFDSPAGKGRLTFKPWNSEPGCAPKVLAGLACGSRIAFLGLSGWQMLPLHPASKGLDPERLDPDLKLALADLLLESVIDDLSVFLGDEVYFCPPLDELWPSVGRVLRFSLELAGLEGKAVTELTLALASEADWRWLLSKISGPLRSKLLVKGQSFNDLAVPFGVSIGSLRLPIASLSTLEPGDLLIPDDPPIKSGLASLELSGLARLTLSLENGWVQVLDLQTFNIQNREQGGAEIVAKEAAVEQTDVSLNSPQQDCAPLDSPSASEVGSTLSLEALELPIKIEAGQLTMTFGQLQTLVPGAIVPFASDPQGPVSVICHGQRIGAGFLVDLGQGILGVQLSEVGLSVKVVSEAALAARLEQLEKLQQSINKASDIDTSPEFSAEQEGDFA
jgi:type III secretion system YscQ/HrcQ family protein